MRGYLSIIIGLVVASGSTDAALTMVLDSPARPAEIQEEAVPNEEKVLNLLKKHVLGYQMSHRPVVYLSKGETNAPAVASWGKTIAPPANVDIGAGVWVAFIDNMPGANYEHSVQYAFIDDRNEVVHVVNATTPPDTLDRDFNRISLQP